MGSLIYLFVNFGPRLITLFKKPESDVESLMKTISVTGILIPLIFIQTGSAAWNVVQFSYYSIVLMGFLLALTINKMHSKLNLLIFSITWIVLLPGVIYTSRDYARPPYAVTFSNLFVQAAEYLASLPRGPVLIYPQYSSNAIVSSISGHPAYLGDQWMLNSYGVNSVLRDKESNKFFDNPGASPPESVKYIFTSSSVTLVNANIANIYNNSEISIYSKKQ